MPRSQHFVAAPGATCADLAAWCATAGLHGAQSVESAERMLLDSADRRLRDAGLHLICDVTTAGCTLLLHDRDGRPCAPRLVLAQPPLVARMQADALAFDASFQAGILQIAHRGPDAEAGHDYEIWAIGGDGVPRSLGLLRGDQVEIPTELTEGITLAVSLEPEGGAPDGAPTGPVLDAAPLAYD